MIMIGFKKVSWDTEEIWECDTCGQRFDGKLRWHSVQKRIKDKLGVRFINVPCKGILRRIK